ncbi:hypothetical protein LTR08_006998 [Meristemomyces frigidus]|nr:hypothetical protein LTR08_006998 [Meristemomyces frigidus]
MRALPRLYGDHGYERNAVTDSKSGSVVAAKSFIHGVHEDVTDIFVKTYTGKRDEGAKGVAKGLGQGLISLTMKMGAGTLGLVTYPCQGVLKSLHAAMHTKARTRVEQAKREENQWLLDNQYIDACCAADIVRGFLSLRAQETPTKVKSRR